MRLLRAVRGFFQNNFEGYSEPRQNISKKVIGKTVSDNEIECFSIGEGNTKVLFLAGIHGNEVGTVKLAHKLINFLSTDSKYTFYILPTLNVDGFLAAKLNPDYLQGGKVGRINKNGVDLNRNFPTKSFVSKATWNHGKNYQEKTEVFAGERGGSEPETQALIKFVKENNIQLIFSFHNVGNDVVGGKDQKSQDMASVYSQNTRCRPISQLEWESLGQTGTLKEWCDENNISFLEIEGKYRWGSDWQVHKKGIMTVLESFT